MGEVRRKFHEELDEMERKLLTMGELAAEAVRASVEAIVERSRATADGVVAGDDRIDELYMQVDGGTLSLLALQAPVAADLRLVSVLLHSSLHVERIGDQAVNVAKLYQVTEGLPTSETVVRHLAEMGDLAVEMTATAMEALRRRDLELCLRLPEMDDPIDRLNRTMHLEVLKLADHGEALDWGMHMTLAARALERVGDQAVDIGEQVGFLLTGEFREFTDASHEVVPADAD
jgi:phosphate transport system protein